MHTVVKKKKKWQGNCIAATSEVDNDPKKFIKLHNSAMKNLCKSENLKR